MLKVIIWKIIDSIFSNSVLFSALLLLCIYQTSGLDFFLIDFCSAILLAGLVMLLTNRINFSLGFTLLLGYIILTFHQAKMKFWGSGFEVGDFRLIFPMVSHSGGIFSEYYSLIVPRILQIVGLTGGLFLIFVRSSKIVEIRNKFFFITIRLAMIVVGLMLIYAMKYSLSQSNSRLNTYLNTKYLPKLQQIKESSTTYGYDGLNQNVGIYASMVFGVRFSNAEAIIEPFRFIKTNEIISKAVKYNKYDFNKDLSDNRDLPDIISVLHESTFNPIDLNLPELFNLNHLKFLSKDEYTVLLGNTKVAIFGGNSQESEYASVSGLNTETFLWQGKAPNLFLTQGLKSSLVTECKKLGYKVVLLYPVDKEFTNAYEAAKSLGVDEVYDIKDFPQFLSKTELQELWPVVSDETMTKIASVILESHDFDKNPIEYSKNSECSVNKPHFSIEEKDLKIGNNIHKLEANKEEQEKLSSNYQKQIAPRKPIFILMSTMSNHGKHAKKYADRFNLSAKFGKKISSKLNDYLDRIIKTDEAFTKFSQFLMSKKHPTLLVQFGDHKPNFEGHMQPLLNLLSSSEDKKYQTFFNIRANFPVNKMPKFNTLDISFIPSVILDLIGIKKNDFFKASSYIRDLCNGNLKKCKLDSKNHSLILEYEKLSIQQIFNDFEI